MLDLIGIGLLGGSVIGLFLTRSEQAKIKQKLRRMITDEIEYVLPKEYGYRVLIKMSINTTEDDYKRREDAFEHKLGYPVIIRSEGDVLYMDIVTKEGEFNFPSLGYVGGEFVDRSRIFSRE